MAATPSIKVKALPSGGRQVIINVPIDLCLSPAPFMGDPIAQADSVAMEVAMHALGEKLGYY